jgi:peptidoglycan/xylan/chitin deacetylase (PgdA/CDA1 family)
VDRPDGASAEVVKARYLAFKDGGKIWGHGIGRKVALTFDDGPHYQTTPRLLDHLEAFGVKATFFVNSNRFSAGSAMGSKNREVIREAHRRGHVLGNHTHAHPTLPQITAEEQQRQVNLTDQAIEGITGAPSLLFRPPYGAITPYVTGLLHQRGSSVFMWNIGSDDTTYFNVARVLSSVMRKLAFFGGGIVLMHDTHFWTTEAVPPVLSAIRVEGCKQLAAGEEPYEVVGLDYFWSPRKGVRAPAAPTDPAAAERAWVERRAEMARRCQAGPTGPLPDFLRGEQP